MVLSKKEIEDYCKQNNLLTNYCPENIQTCSYDLRMGDQYYFYKKKHGDKVCISTLEKGKTLKIPPNSICYVITEETVNMPRNLTASISLSFGLIKRGVMLAAQPPYDPGYCGKTVALLHNLSNEPVTIKRGQHILNMVFMKLGEAIEPGQEYRGDYQELKDLNDYCTEVKVGAVFELKRELEKERKKITNFLPNILTVITFIIAVLTVLFTILIGASSINESSHEGPTSEVDSNSLYPEFSVNEETNILTISIDGKNYEIALNDGLLQPEGNPDN